MEVWSRRERERELWVLPASRTWVMEWRVRHVPSLRELLCVSAASPGPHHHLGSTQGPLLSERNVALPTVAHLVRDPPSAPTWDR